MSDERQEAITAFRLRQPMAELYRKEAKAVRRDRLWTQEELDVARKTAHILATEIQWD